MVVVAVAVVLSAIYPLVAEPQNRVLSLVLIGASAVAIGMAFGPLRRSEASPVLWLVPAGLVVCAVVILPFADLAFPIATLIRAAATALGLWSSRPPDPDTLD